jgi:MYXO-CTERM domain-containing protein
MVTIPALALAGCGDEGDVSWLRQPLSAFCTVDVTGKGTRQVETDYLPHVVACENGAADTEALKAQAVAARSYLYYKIKQEGGSICDGTGCQVYTCSNKPQQKHFDAVRATSGQVLVYSGVVICGFYVAGAKPSTPTCEPLPTDPDPTKTEKYVTYNEGRSGADVTQSTLGWVDPGNIYNRGCKSQNGAHCLSLAGRPYPEILRFYYGADIQLVTAPGSCVNPPPDGAPAGERQPPRLDGGSTADWQPGTDLPPPGGDRSERLGGGGCACRFGQGPRPVPVALVLLFGTLLLRRRPRR